jgi:hypothetical protein
MLAPQQEPPTTFEQERSTLYVRAGEIVDEDFVDVKDGVGLGDFELGELAVKADVLLDREGQRKINDRSGRGKLQKSTERKGKGTNL